VFLVLPGPVEGTATDGRFRYGRYSFTLDGVPYGGESWAEGSPGAGGSLGRVFNAGPTPAMRRPDTPTSTLTLKLRHLVLSADGGARFLWGPFLDPKMADFVLFLAEFKIIFKSI
jgi:hypothetical protein